MVAWHVLESEPDASVVVLEAGRCGFGPTGRNGGFVQSLAPSRPVLRERFGQRAADALVDASEDSVRAIGPWCAAQGVDGWYRPARHHGVGPSHLAGRALAALALGREDGPAALAIVGPPPRRVPPEPLRVAGAALIRRALVAKEAAEQDGRRPSLIARAVAALPGKRGMHIVRRAGHDEATGPARAPRIL